MKLSFPNPSRSFDDSGKRIRFWGYDRAIEVSFFIGVDALKRLCPKMVDADTGFLKAFDEVRNRIHEVADEVYVRSGRGKAAYAYVLVADDF